MKSGGKNRFNMVRQRAAYQHVDYVRQLEPPRPYRSAEVDPGLWSSKEEIRTVFGYPEITRQPTETEMQKERDIKLRSQTPERSASYKGCIAREVELEAFGHIEVHHADIFSFWEQELTKHLEDLHLAETPETVGRAMILPMAPNLLPYRGLGLEAYDRGGPALVKAIYEAAHLQEDGTTKDEIHLEAGDALELPLHLSMPSFDKLMKENEAKMLEMAPEEKENLKEKLQKEKDFNKAIFMIMPWIWEGSPVDAEKRFRFCAREALRRASLHCQRVSKQVSAKRWKYREGTVAIPSIGGGIFGFEPKNSSLTLMEEAFDTLLQVEASEPSYALKRICFVDANEETAESLASALVEVSRRWLPSRRLTSAPQWCAKQTRRLLVLPDVPNFFWRRHRVKFKKRHGVKKRQRVHYMGNIKPTLWRAHRVRQPPPLLVHQEDGRIAAMEEQLKPLPYFFRGVSHWLFPSRSNTKGGFHSLKRNAGGHWVGVRGGRMVPQSRPKM